VPRLSTKSYRKGCGLWKVPVLTACLVAGKPRGAERAEHGWPGKLSNVIEGSGTFQNSRETSRSFEKAEKPIYTVVCVGGLFVGRKVCVPSVCGKQCENC